MVESARMKNDIVHALRRPGKKRRNGSSALGNATGVFEKVRVRLASLIGE
jgi:hypothetical protein